MMTLRQTIIIINVCCKLFHPAPTPNIRNRRIFFLSARQPAVSSGLIKVSHSCSVWDIVPKHAHIWKLLCSILWLRCATLKSEHPGGPVHLRAARWLTFTDTARGTSWRSSKSGLYRLSVWLPCRSRMCITSAREHNESSIHSLPSPKWRNLMLVSRLILCFSNPEPALCPRQWLPPRLTASRLNGTTQQYGAVCLETNCGSLRVWNHSENTDFKLNVKS